MSNLKVKVLCSQLDTVRGKIEYFLSQTIQSIRRVFSQSFCWLISLNMEKLAVTASEPRFETESKDSHSSDLPMAKPAQKKLFCPIKN